MAVANRKSTQTCGCGSSEFRTSKALLTGAQAGHVLTNPQAASTDGARFTVIAGDGYSVNTPGGQDVASATGTITLG